MDDAGADDKAAAAGQAQALEGAQDNDGPASAAAPLGTSDNDLSSVAGVSSASPSSDLHLLIRGQHLCSTVLRVYSRQKRVSFIV